MYYDGHKIFIDNGYPAIYLPNHPKAKQNGTIRIHILQAEKQLGRCLYDEEFVHHCDENKMNYGITNLWVFKTNGDHTTYHHAMKYGIECVLSNVDGVYSCEIKYGNGLSKYCDECGRPKTNVHHKLCLKCHRKNMRKRIPAKNDLAQDIRIMAFTHIGAKCGVTDNAVRKWCKGYGLPYKQKDIAVFDFDAV